MNFKDRSTEKEVMDSNVLDKELLKLVFRDINIVNKSLNGFSITLNAIEEMIRYYPQSKYTIMDLGCGDGQILRQVADHYNKSGIKMRLVGLNLNPKALEIARENSKNYPNISYLEKNILTLEGMQPQCDILLCTLTMHHFGSKDISEFQRKIIPLVHLGIIINDLQRSRISYYLFKLYSKIFIKTKIAENDGLISIKSAFTRSDLINFSKAIPRVDHEIRWKWAFRYLWVMRVK